MPNFEVLRCGGLLQALNRIIHNSQFKRRISLERNESSKRRPFSPMKTDDLYDLRVLPGHWGPTILSRIMSTYSHRGLRNDDIQEFDSKWDRILLSMTMVSWKDCTN